MGGNEIAYLKPLKKYYLIQLSGFLFLIISFVAGSGFLAGAFLGTLGGVTTALIASLISSFLVAFRFSKEAMAGTEFLARAILYVSPKSVGIAAPNPKLMPASQDFFGELARNVYEMASSSYAKSLEKQQTEYQPNKLNETLLLNSPLAIFVINKKGDLIYINPVAEKFIAVDVKQAIGKPFYDSVKLTFDTNQTLESWLNESKTKTATNTQYWDRVKINTTNDNVKYCDMAVRFNRDNPDGVETVIMLYDHTDKYLNDEHGIGTISMAVHELRTPITAMRGYIEVFEDEVAQSLNPEQKQFMNALSAQAQQLGSFISNIQNFAKIEENSMSLSLREEDWGSIVSNAVNNMQLRAKVRKKNVVAEIPEGLPRVAVDKVTIHEVLTNLIENAIKYTHSSEPIVVSCNILNNNCIETTITDKGIGIPESLLGNLFERFYRSHRSSASIGGMGLGLYLSKSIVVAHGGEIWVKSKEGQGSTFGFTVPTYEFVANNNKIDKNTGITRTAHGWIKNHNLYRG